MPPKGINAPPYDKSAADIKRELKEKIRSDQDSLELIESIEEGSNEASRIHGPEIEGWAHVDNLLGKELASDREAGVASAHARVENDAVKRTLENKKNELQSTEARAKRDGNLEKDVLALEEEIRSLEKKVKPTVESEWGFTKPSVIEYFKSRQAAFESGLEKSLELQKGAPLSMSRISPKGAAERKEFGRLRIEAADLAYTLEKTENQEEALNARKELATIREQLDALYTRVVPEKAPPTPGASMDTSMLEEGTDKKEKDEKISTKPDSEKVDDKEGRSNLKVESGPPSSKAEVTDAEFEEIKSTVLKGSSDTGAEGQKLPTHEPDEKASSKEARDGKEKIKRAEEAVRSEKEAMLAAEEAYLTEYKKFHATKKIYNLKEPKELTALKEAYDKTRLTYANALQESARKRLEARPGRVRLSKRIEVMERYNGLMRYREVVRPSAEKVLQARFDALDSRKQGIVGKSLTWLAIRNTALEEKHGKNKARVIRAAATTLAVTGAIGAFGTTIGIAGLAGFGMARFAQALTAAFVGAAAGEGAAQLVDRVRQKNFGKDKELFEKNRRKDGELDLKSLAKLDERQTAITKGTSERDRHKQKTIVRALMALGVGMGAAGAISEAFAATDAVESPSKPGTDATPAENKQTLRSTIDELEQANGAAGEPAEVSKADAEIEAPRAGVEGRLEAGDGANELLYELRAGLVEQYGADLKGAPEYVKHFVNDQTMLERSYEFGFMTNEGSVLVHPDATLSFNEQGELIMSDPQGVGTVKLMDAEGKTVDSEVSKVKAFEHLPDSPPAAPEAAAAQPATVPAEQATAGEAAPPEEAASDVTASVPVTPGDTAALIEPPTSTEAQPLAPLEAVIGSTGPMTLGSLMDAEGSALPQEVVPNTAIEEGRAPKTLGELSEPVAAPEGAPEAGAIVPEAAAPEAGQVESPMTLESFSGTIQPVEGNPQLAYISAENATVAQSLATTYAQEHPGTKIVFDNPKSGLFGFFDRPRVSSVVLNPADGKLIFTEQELDTEGKPLLAVERTVLGEPTNLA